MGLVWFHLVHSNYPDFDGWLFVRFGFLLFVSQLELRYPLGSGFWLSLRLDKVCVQTQFEGSMFSLTVNLFINVCVKFNKIP